MADIIVPLPEPGTVKNIDEALRLSSAFFEARSVWAFTHEGFQKIVIIEDNETGEIIGYITQKEEMAILVPLMVVDELVERVEEGLSWWFGAFGADIGFSIHKKILERGMPPDLWRKNESLLQVQTYLVIAPSLMLCKIGRSINSLARIYSIRTDCPLAVELRGWINEDIEKSLHQLFKRFKIQGEWFEFNSEIEARFHEDPKFFRV